MSSGLKIVAKGTGTPRMNALAYMNNNGNSLMDSGTGAYFLSAPSSRGGFACGKNNWRRAVALFGARKLVTGNWINDKDEYMAPDETAAGYDQWVNDCHVYALLHPSNNCTAMREVQYKGKSWRIKNNWFWRTRATTLDSLNNVNTGGLYRDARAENEDAYFAQVLESITLSDDARRVLALMDALWIKSLDVREDYAAGHPDLHLMAHDAGVYQLKQLWKALYPTEWEEIRATHKALADRLRDGVYDYGFLRR